MRIVAILNQKGGCGKTTTAINVAGVLAKLGLRTLLVDLDPQTHCAAGLGIPEQNIDLNMKDALLAAGKKKIDDGRLLWRAAKNLDLAPSSMKLAGLEAARGGLATAEDRDQRLSLFLEERQERYDWAILDCPPSIGLLTYNALRAATEVLIPVETSFFAMKGAQRQVRTIRSLARRLGGKTPHRILATMHDPDNRLAVELLADLRQTFPDEVIPHVVRLDHKLQEAATFGQPAIEYDPASMGARDYANVASYLIENDPHRRHHRAGASARSSATQRAATQSATEELSADQAQSRALDLASRVRRLLAKSAEIQAKLVTAGVTPRPDDVNTTSTTHAAPLEEAPVAHIATGRLERMAGARETSQGVLFLHPAMPQSHVFIAGDFNGWSASATPLQYNEQAGVHEVCVDMPPGRCEYRLIVDGRWMADPFNEMFSTNPFGEKNSVVVVTRRQTAVVCGEGAD